jgi:hypothetical protein
MLFGTDISARWMFFPAFRSVRPMSFYNLRYLSSFFWSDYFTHAFTLIINLRKYELGLKIPPNMSLVCNRCKLQSCVFEEANEDFKSLVCTMGW